MKKKWIKDLTSKEVIHAPTEEIANKLCKKFDELGLKWIGEKSYLNENRWRYFEKNMCYRPNTGGYCERDWYKKSGFPIYTIENLLDFADGHVHYDMRNNHYKKLKLDPFKIMEENCSREEIMGAIKLNILKYTLREKGQDKEDFEKIIAYAEWGLKQLEK